MKPITGILKWRLQARARAEVSPHVQRVAGDPDKVTFDDLKRMCHPVPNIVLVTDQPQVVPIHAPSWRHVTQRRNHG